MYLMVSSRSTLLKCPQIKGSFHGKILGIDYKICSQVPKFFSHFAQLSVRVSLDEGKKQERTVYNSNIKGKKCFGVQMVFSTYFFHLFALHPNGFLGAFRFTYLLQKKKKLLSLVSNLTTVTHYGPNNAPIISQSTVRCKLLLGSLIKQGKLQN